jgi:Spy/CpxP family protein refolding chaperone
MKRASLYLALVAVFGLASIAAGQDSNNQGQSQGQGQGQWGRHGGHMMDPDAQLGRLSQDLKLTDDQKAKIKPILEDQFKKGQALRQDTSLSSEDMHMKFREIRQNSSKQIRALLTADQQKKYDALIMDERHGPGGRHSRSEPGDQPPPAQ